MALSNDLREYADAIDKDRGFVTEPTRLMREAADEIDRLRAKVNVAQAYRESQEGLPEGTIPRV